MLSKTIWEYLVNQSLDLVSEPLDEDEAEIQRRTIVSKYDRVSANYICLQLAVL